MTPAEATTLIADAFAVGTGMLALLGAYKAGRLVIGFIRK